MTNTDLRSHFGFHTMPFTRELSLEHRFEIDAFNDALHALRRTIEDRMSGALIAPAGSGKSALLRALVDQLPQARYRVHYVKVTSLSKRDLCREIACALGLSPTGSYPGLVRKVQDFFQTTSDTNGLRPVLIFDDAHEMRPEVLGLLRILTNFDMDSRLVVSILLAGQAPLRTMLRRDHLEDIARRLAHIATLRPLSRDESARYVEHRCKVAGAQSLPFDPRAMDALYEIACGNLRATDRIALGALQAAHGRSVPVADHTDIIEARSRLWL